MRIEDLGLIPYQAALDIQIQALDAVASGSSETLFLLEHPPVVTFGRNGGEENLPFSRAFFQERGVDVLRSTRGGNVTCHFPGQLVAYPIMRVDRRPGGLRRYFHDLEETVLRTLEVFEIKAERSPGRPGIWLGGEKICSTGIAVKRWITCHGLSLNVGADLSLFDMVAPCGLSGVRATSVQRRQGCETVTVERVKQVFANVFAGVFGVEWLDSPWPETGR